MTSDRLQNLQMAMVALLLFALALVAVYVGAYLYLGVREDSMDIGGRFVNRRFPSSHAATVFQPLGSIESLVLLRRVIILGPQPGFLTNDPPELGY